MRVDLEISWIPARLVEQDMLSRILDSSAHVVILDEISSQFMFDVLSCLSASIQWSYVSFIAS